MDWPADNRIVSYIAKNQQSYLDLQENSLSTLFSDRRKWSTEQLAEIAGVVKYQDNLEDLLS